MAQYTKKQASAAKRSNWPLLVAIALVAVALVAVGAEVLQGKTDAAQGGGAEAPAEASVAVDQDLVIPISAITTTAAFYPVEIEGTRLEVLAVQAPDGSIRTAFNTCQVCYDSGRGYYKQQGDVLVCQNCGNRFAMGQVEVQSGGCNPVPIFAGNKTVDAETITISKEFLTEAKVIFANWKTEY
ncbi:MAG: DUF2318 domain-containing protein [Christensenellaceae bacterium]|jgi:uncharacterized membrane protein|nr:DUF2318 domain-containing protein [Christensenellaceae bacterium]